MLSGKHAEVSKNRLAIFTSKDKSEVNLHSKLYPKKSPVSNLVVYSVPNCERIPFDDAVKNKSNFKPAKIGDTFGPSWSTHWFEIEFTVPDNWKGEEVHLLWDSECEALLWTTDGLPIQGFLGSGGEDRRAEYFISGKANGGEKYHFYVEMACTAMFGNGTGNGWGGLGPTPTDLKKEFKLKQVEIGVLDRTAYDLLAQFTIIADLAKMLPEDSFRASQALYTANQIMNTFYLDDKSTWPKALQIARDFLSIANGPTAHNISAIGHCHIDTAWLWPYAETKRKCARSWASQLRIMERFPQYKFGCSQAQQFEWMKELYPKLYSQIKEAVKNGQFVPIGATWVEMDCNIPSGEAFVRQFLIGQRFYKQEFGHYCREFWLPDTFGYAAQLPQIILNSGCEFFMTQKLSWAQFNKFPHQTFYWEGLDGTRVLTHFPPTDTYNAQANVKDNLFHLKNFKEKERSNESLMVYGHGDGGGGPLPSMVENLIWMKDTDPIGKIEMRSPTDFFERVKKDAKDLAVWIGELYFEYHRGTYTSQAKNKLGNRKSELLLHNIEVLSVLALLSKQKKYPIEELSRLWKLLLLNQFHDVLPGSSINEVYKDSAEHYADIEKSGNKLLQEAIAALGEHKPNNYVAFNTLPWKRSEVAEIPFEVAGGQKTNDGKTLVYVEVPSMGFSTVHKQDSHPTLHIQESNGTFVLSNSNIRATFSPNGRISSLFDLKLQKEAIQPGKFGNQFVIYEDVPMYWDAWDVDVYHLEKRHDLNDATVKIVENGPIRVALEISLKISEHSSLKQIISLTSYSQRLDFQTFVDWHESHKFLKVEFPLNIRALHATFEIQYGHIQRPTHWNTSWDVARFEVCAHKWADLSEHGFGVSLLNDCKYGYAAHNNILRLSLLRSPKNPDPECDMGHHTFKYALFTHQGDIQGSHVIREAHAFNNPLIFSESALSETKSFFSVDNESVILDAVKKAEDSGDIIVRFYESFGGRCDFHLKSEIPFKSVSVVNMIEEEIDPKEIGLKEVKWNNGEVALSIKPFQVITLKLHV